MTILQMRYFAAVCREQNITRAARALAIAQSTLSQSLQALEQETGLNLIRHAGRGIAITKDGQALYLKIMELLRRIDRFDGEVLEMARRRDYVRLALPPQLATQFLPHLLGEFRTQHPEIRLDITETSATEAAQMVKDESVDFAVLNRDEELLPELNYRAISERPICLAIWPEHPLATSSSITCAEAVAAGPLLLLAPTAFVTRKALSAFAYQGLEPEILFYSPNLSSIVSLLQQHIAPAILTTQAMIACSGLLLLPITETKDKAPLSLTTCLVTKKGRQVYDSQRQVMSALRGWA